MNSTAISGPQRNEVMNAGNRFKIIKEIGSGSFSIIYHASDNHKSSDVALKMEKPDKAKKILIGEFEFLKKLLGKNGIV